MKNEPLYEGIPLRAHQFVLSEFWPQLTEWQKEHWFPRTWRMEKRRLAKGSYRDKPIPDAPDGSTDWRRRRNRRNSPAPE